MCLSVIAPLERYEFKYLVTPELMDPIRDAVLPYCSPDPNAKGRGKSYTITTLYLDSPDFSFYRAKKNRHMDRIKLRIRTYGERADGPVFFEVKRRFKDMVIKHRSRVDRALWQQLADCRNLQQAADDEALNRFLYNVQRSGAEPVALVRYQREALASDLDPYARITFDRFIVGQAANRFDFLGDSTGWRGLDDPTTTRIRQSASVLELKFPARAPIWMAQLVRRFELVRVGFSKYCNGIEAALGRLAPGQETARSPAIWSLDALQPRLRGGRDA